MGIRYKGTRTLGDRDEMRDPTLCVKTELLTNASHYYFHELLEAPERG